jgi:hypothetical protein
MRYSYADVLAMVREDVTSWTEAGTVPIQRDRLARKLSEPLLANPHALGPRGSRVAQLQADAFYSQVRKALEALTAEGVIRKTPKSMRGPDGRPNYAGFPRYWTPALWDAAVQDRANRAALKEATAERWAKVNEGLAAAGVPHGNLPTEPPNLGLAAWELLIGKLASAELFIASVRRELHEEEVPS